MTIIGAPGDRPDPSGGALRSMWTPTDTLYFPGRYELTLLSMCVVDGEMYFIYGASTCACEGPAPDSRPALGDGRAADEHGVDLVPAERLGRDGRQLLPARGPMEIHSALHRRTPTARRRARSG